MSFVRNRELSQFGSFLYIDNATKNIGITTTGTPYVGIGTDNPTSLLTVGGDVNISGILTASSFVVGDGSSSGFLKADGTVDTNTYTTSTSNTLDSVTDNGNTTTNNITVGNITANSFIKTGGTASQFLKADGTVDTNTYLTTTGSGSNLSGIVTSIIAGTNITISGSTGEVTINALGSDAVSSQWVTTASGIHTTSNVGIGSTIPKSKLDIIGDVNVSGVVTATDFNSTSDITLKTNINQIENSLDKIVHIRGVNFEWKKDHRQSAGVIAQEVEKVFPELVSTGDHKTVNYNGIIGVLIEAIKELKSEVEELKNKLK